MKRIVVMQDISCLGKCSLTVILPVISAMGVECAVLPTAVLSTHTAFPSPAVTGLSDFAEKAMAHWKSIGAHFDGILTGYLASADQVHLATRLMDEFAGADTKIIVDPAMGDHGKLYSGLPEEMIPAMASLCRRADLCLPNLTEGALMAGLTPEDRADPDYCRTVARGLLDQGCQSVLLTGAEPEEGKLGFFHTDGTSECCIGAERVPRNCHGTGDLFAAVMAGGLVRGLTAQQSGNLAMELIRRSILSTGQDSRWGVAFEAHLGWLAGAVEEMLG